MKIIKISPAFTDERGSIWDLLSGKNIHHVGFLTSKKGSIRGKHYHKKQIQYTLVTKGAVKITGKDLSKKNSKIETYILKEMEMVCFPKYYYHAIESLKESKILVFTSRNRLKGNYEKDTFRIKDLK